MKSGGLGKKWSGLRKYIRTTTAMDRWGLPSYARQDERRANHRYWCADGVHQPEVNVGTGHLLRGVDADEGP